MAAVTKNGLDSAEEWTNVSPCRPLQQHHVIERVQLPVPPADLLLGHFLGVVPHAVPLLRALPYTPRHLNLSSFKQARCNHLRSVEQ